MINIVKVKLENKTDKPFIYYFSNSKVTLNPGIPFIIEGDLFSKETRQEGNTESLLVNVYNGNIELTLIYDDTFINKVEKSKVVNLPKRAQVKLINKDSVSSKPVIVENPVIVEKPVTPEKPVIAEKKETTVAPESVVSASTSTPVEAKDASEKKGAKAKTVDKKIEDKPLESTVVEDGKAKKQVTKI